MSGILGDLKAKSGFMKGTGGATRVDSVSKTQLVAGEGSYTYIMNPNMVSLDVQIQGSGSGAQGAWAGAQAGYSGGLATACGISVSAFTDAQRAGAAITATVGQEGQTTGAHNGNDNGASASSFGPYLLANATNGENNVLSTATSNFDLNGGGTVELNPGRTGAPGGVNTSSRTPTRSGGGYTGGAADGAGSGGGPPGGGGGGPGTEGFVLIVEHLE